jgi:peptidoglycan hydrolase-like protein with peptidoglycan-binding domain
VDGIVGPLTNAAIRQFQQAETGVVDGRVDVNGLSIKTLEYLHVARIDSQAYTLVHYGIIDDTAARGAADTHPPSRPLPHRPPQEPRIGRKAMPYAYGSPLIRGQRDGDRGPNFPPKLGSKIAVWAATLDPSSTVRTLK